MTKRKGNEFGRITRRKDAKPLAGKDASEQPKKKLTMYLEPEIWQRVMRLEFELKTHHNDLGHKYSRTAIINTALEMVLDNFDADLFDSELVHRLHERS